MILEIDRDSVAAGDDVGSHITTIQIDPDISVKSLIKKAEKACPLPSIYGGKATWIIFVGSNDERICVGVTAQQWRKNRLLVTDTITAGEIFNGIAKKLKFHYWLQNSPNHVFEILKKGEMPDKY